MNIDPDEAVASKEHDGKVFYFCGEGCHRAFLADPHRFGHPEEK
jgi:Cu+-exporting ATPase